MLVTIIWAVIRSQVVTLVRLKSTLPHFASEVVQVEIADDPAAAA